KNQGLPWFFYARWLSGAVFEVSAGSVADALATDMFVGAVVEPHQAHPAAPDTTGVEGKEVSRAGDPIQGGPMAEDDIVSGRLSAVVGKPGGKTLGCVSRPEFALQFQPAVGVAETHAGEVIGDHPPAIRALQ